MSMTHKKRSRSTQQAKTPSPDEIRHLAETIHLHWTLEQRLRRRVHALIAQQRLLGMAL